MNYFIYFTSIILLSLTHTPRQLNKVLIIQHCLPLASRWWFDLDTWLFLGLWNLTLFFPENFFHGNAFFFRCHLWFCWWSKSPVSCQLKAHVHQSRFPRMCFSFQTLLLSNSVFWWAECLLLTLHTLKKAIFNYAKSFFWNTALAKPFGWTWAFKPQYLNTNSPDWYPNISFKNKLWEFKKSSKHFAFSDYSINCHNISLDDVLMLLGENICWSTLGIKGF